MIKNEINDIISIYQIIKISCENIKNTRKYDALSK
jgi:hypothetical protein